MGSPLEKFFFALGRGVKAAKNSAAERKAAEPAPPPPEPEYDPRKPPPATLDLVRCPKCGTYAPAGRVCTCSP